jgi:transcriptional regulator of acetoin/glycerol metabolism
MIPDQTTQQIHDRTIKTMVKAYVLAMLNDNEYNVSDTAKQLGISRMSLYRKMVDYGINKSRKQKAKKLA